MSAGLSGGVGDCTAGWLWPAFCWLHTDCDVHVVEQIKGLDWALNHHQNPRVENISDVSSLVNYKPKSQKAWEDFTVCDTGSPQTLDLTNEKLPFKQGKTSAKATNLPPWTDRSAIDVTITVQTTKITAETERLIVREIKKKSTSPWL